MCLAAAEKVLWPIICRLSSNNRPITDYLKNSRLIGFADYLPINRLITSSKLRLKHRGTSSLGDSGICPQKILKIRTLEMPIWALNYELQFDCHISEFDFFFTPLAPLLMKANGGAHPCAPPPPPPPPINPLLD